MENLEQFIYAIATPISPREARSLGARWHETFRPAFRVRSPFDWDRFGVGAVPCVSGEAAVEEFVLAVSRATCIVAWRENLADPVRCPGPLVVSPEIVRATASDLYVSNGELDWTLAMSHEAETVGAPFFALRAESSPTEDR